MDCGLLRRFRKRWHKAEAVDAILFQKDVKALFFDVIPHDALENVVRFLSLSYRAKDWRKGMLAYDVAPLFGVEGAVQEFACSEFNTIYTDTNFSRIFGSTLTILYGDLRKTPSSIHRFSCR